MIIDTERFGTIELDDVQVIEFPLGLPGFEELTRFIIMETEESRPIYWLQSTENAYVCLPVVIPFEFMEDYYVEVRDFDLEELTIDDERDLLILNVVVIPEDLKLMTANLAAPIIINTRLGRGKQIIVDAKEMPVRFPIFERIMHKLKGGEQDAGTIQKEG